MILDFIKRWIKSIFCKHKYRLSATGRYKGTINGRIDVYYFECQNCYKTKEVITYPNKPE